MVCCECDGQIWDSSDEKAEKKQAKAQMKTNIGPLDTMQCLLQDMFPNKIINIITTNIVPHKLKSRVAVCLFMGLHKYNGSNIIEEFSWRYTIFQIFN
jgi:hypothetical protein